MTRKRSDSGWRAAAFAVALLAVTLNFLQPLAHAALMRDGGPTAAARIWGTLCLSAVDQDENGTPATAAIHDCCLGLAHAPVLAELSTAFTVIERVAAPVRVDTDVAALSPVGIRDGPSQPRAPPHLV
jgi:hypothetical protein